MLSGVIGQFFRALSITLASAVLISLVRRHALDAHALELSDDQIRDLMEVEQ